jgi:hypothetical protein
MGSKEKVSEPPEITAKFLDLIRLLPADTNLIDFHERYGEVWRLDPEARLKSIREKYRMHEGDPVMSIAIVGGDERAFFEHEIRGALAQYREEVLSECVGGLPQGFVEYIRSDTTDESLKEVYLAYSGGAEGLLVSFEYFTKTIARTEIVIKRVNHLEVSKAIQRYASIRLLYQRTYELLDYIELNRIDPHIAAISRFGRPDIGTVGEIVIKQDRIVFMPDPFVAAFNGVDSSRLSRCGACRRVFWKPRIKSKGCEPRCTGKLRIREWRKTRTPERDAKYKFNKVTKG